MVCMCADINISLSLKEITFYLMVTFVHTVQCCEALQCNYNAQCVLALSACCYCLTRAVKLAPFTMFNTLSRSPLRWFSHAREASSCALCSRKFSIAKTMLSSCLCMRVCACVCMYASKSRLLVSECVCVRECLRVSCGLLSI